MWTCNCSKILSNGDYSVRMYPTQVTHDNICVNCEHYAMWIDAIDNCTGHQNIPVTAINKHTNELTHFGDVHSAARHCSINAVNVHTSMSFRAGKLYRPKNSKYMFIKGELTEMPEEGIDDVGKSIIYAYNMEHKLVGSAPTKKKMSEITGDSVQVIYSNLNRNTSYSRLGFVYTHNKNFDSEDYAKTPMQSTWE